MKGWIKKLLLALLIFVIVLVGFVGLQLSKIGPAATGYTAKMICSAIFVVGQTPGEAYQDFPDNPIKPLLKIKVDKENRTVTASLAGLCPRKAVFREGYGATLVSAKGFLQDLPPFPQDDFEANIDAEKLLWPQGELVSPEPLPEGVIAEKLQQALDNAFSEPNPETPRRTRAVVILKGERIVAERYGFGFTKDTPLLGWSMTKSIVNALVGILVGQGKLDIYSPAPVPEWSSPDDPRHAITTDQLLRMSSGLEFLEDYGDLAGDAIQMLYVADCAAALAANKPLVDAPDSVWHYSSGTANIVARIVRETLGGAPEDYLAFPQRNLFAPLGMRGALLEPDPSGIFVGSSFTYATARDWARFGLFYLQDGVWNGKRVLPEGWVTYSRTPTPRAPQGKYGAFFRMNAGIGGDPATQPWPELPADMYYAHGHDGQDVIIIPSRDLVIVRLGLSQKKGAWDIGTFVGEVLEAFPVER